MLLQPNTKKKSRAKKYFYYAQLFFLLTLSRLCVWLLPFAVLKRFFGTLNQEATPHKIKNHSVNVIQNVQLGIRTVSNRAPFSCTCLVQALAAKLFLKLQGVESTLYLGMHKTNEDFGAHAWLRTGDYIVTGAPEHENCVVVSSYT